MTTTSSTPVSRQIGAMTLTLKSDTEIELTRVFNAPRRLVFEAHSKAEHVRRWWGGGPGITMIVCEMDFRPGGKWRYVLRKDTGQEVRIRRRIPRDRAAGVVLVDLRVRRDAGPAGARSLSV